MILWTLFFTVAITNVDGNAFYGRFKRDNCRGEDRYGRGLRQYSSRLFNVAWGSSRKEICSKTAATINGQTFQRATRCVKAASYMWGEFDVLDPTCNVDRRWVLKELRELIGFSFNCDWSRFTSNGCSVPLHDPVSILFKDKFDKACVVHDYCYASPWGRDRGGRDKCDLKFKELMDKICRGNLPCLATSGIYYVAVRSAAGSVFDRIQDQVENGRVTCKKYKNHSQLLT